MKSARETMEEFLLWTLEREPELLKKRLEAEEWEAFHDYYRSLPDRGDRGAMARHLRGSWRGESGFVVRWVAERPGARVLDAGSGFGSFSMLFAAAGARVTGADLRPDRLSVGEKRARLYREETGRALELEYLRCDLTSAWPGDFDLVWVYNALSHIHPLPQFLAELRRHLRPGGVLVIGDINGAFAPHRRRLARARHQVYSEYVAPDGRRHAYAVEKTFGPTEMRSVLAGAGLRVVRHELFWGGQGRAGEWLYRDVLAPLGRMWWLGIPVARRQLVVASQGESL